MEQHRGIAAEGLVREFKGGIRAVDGIDLEVAPGEIYGFLGPNGAGKSTTVLMLTTLLPPTAGTARVYGFDVVKEGPKVRERIGAALQEAALDPLLTGREHLRLQTAPRILFLDEPTTGLDPQSRTALWEEVGRLSRDDGVTVFLTTQYLEEADLLADRVGIIDHGHIVAEGTPTALKAEIGRPTVDAVPADPADRESVARILERFGERTAASPKGVAVRLVHGEADLAEISRALDEEGLHVEQLQLHAPSLDDVFLAKTGRSLEGAQEEPQPVGA
jgi:ABC-2 type transport system ATP-binding protein